MNNSIWKSFFVRIFGFIFIFLVVAYTFFDDGGIGTKGLSDFIAIPLVSSVFSLIFSTIITLTAFVSVKFLSLFSRS